MTRIQIEGERLLKGISQLTKRVAPLITDTPPTNFTTLSGEEEKN